LLKHLVEYCDLRVVILETNLAATLRLNKFVLAGEGTAREALSATEYWSTANAETLELIEWLRDYNSESVGQGKSVQVWGCDVQSIDPAVAELKRRVSAFAANRLMSADDCEAVIRRLDALPTDRELYRHVEALAAAASSSQPNMDEIHVLQSRRAADMRAAREAAAEVVCSLERLCPQLRNSVDANHAFVFERCIWSLEQAMQFYSPHGELARDRLMSENILALRSHFRGKKLAILAHNLHVMRSPLTIRGHRFESLGCFLRRQASDDYRVIGSLLHHGSYVASPGGSPADIEIAEAHIPRDDTWEHHCRLHCAAAGLPGAVVVFDAESRKNETVWMKQLRLRLGEVGAQGSYEDAFIRQSPCDQYDGLLFVSESTGISVLPEYFASARARWNSESE
jgi:erythromycin esterase